MERGHEEGRMREVERCFTYEKGQDSDKCCGASGRKLRQVCFYCPNYIRWKEQREREEKDGDKGKNVY